MGVQLQSDSVDRTGYFPSRAGLIQMAGICPGCPSHGNHCALPGDEAKVEAGELKDLPGDQVVVPWRSVVLRHCRGMQR